MSTARSESGFITFKAVLSVLFFIALVFAGFKIIPPYISNYQLQNSMDNLARTATYSRMSDDDIRKEVLTSATELDIPVDASQVIVGRPPSGVSIFVQYDVTVDLLVRQLELHFAPSAGNRNITAR